MKFVITNTEFCNLLQFTAWFSGSAAQVGNEMAHQLHVLQTLMLNVLEDRINKPVDPNDADAQEKIRELCRIAFDSDCSEVHVKDVTTRKANHETKYYRKLGFKNETTPLQDFGTMQNNSENKWLTFYLFKIILIGMWLDWKLFIGWK